MRTSPPLRDVILWVALSLSGVPLAGAAEPIVLADGLRGANALALTPTSAGSLRLLVAESDAGTLTKLTVLGESVISREQLGPLPEVGVAGLAFIGERCVMLTSAGVTSIALDGWLGEMKPPVGESVLGPPASTSRWLYAPGADTLLRGRLALGRVTRLRRIDRPGPSPLAMTISPEGYLVTVASSTEGHRLEFLDPERVDASPAWYALSGLVRPQAIAYAGGVNEADLLAIDAELGLMRIISRVNDRRAEAVAEAIDAPADVVALAPTPDGDLLLLTPSRLLRWRPKL